MVRNLFTLFLPLFALSLLSSCQKKKTNDCFADAATVRQIVNKPATVQQIGTEYYLIEQGTIDTRLLPCKLEKEFQVDKLAVIISGNVKSTITNGLTPCCTENFVITSIKK